MARLPTAKVTQNTITPPVEEYSAADVVVSVSTLTMTTALNPPVEVIRYDNPSSLAGVLTLNAPQTGPTFFATTLALTGTVNAPTPESLVPNPTILSLTATLEAPAPTVTFLDTTQTLSLTLNDPEMFIYSLPSTLAGTITVNAPVPIITAEPTTVPIIMTLEDATATPTATPVTIEGTLSVLAPIPNAITTATTLNLTLTVNAPTPVVTNLPLVRELTISAAFSPTLGDISPTIVKYIKDPIVNGGCAQCGTLLWQSHSNAVSIESERVIRGRNKDRNDGVPDNRYVRCARCGFINNMNRASSQPDGAKAGWAIDYTEFRVVPNEPLD